MIGKLRAKLIGISMISMLVVLLTIVGTINVVSYQKIISDADSILSVLEENGGKFPKMQPPPTAHQFDGKPKYKSPELPYESRYFSVALDTSGQVITSDIKKIAAVDEEQAVTYAHTVLEKGREKGFLGDYRYIVQTSDTQTLIIFLDCGRSLSSFRSNLITSVWVSFLGLTAVFILIILFSKYAIGPVAESYEKQKRFITDAGHELKTPLTIINADAEILSMDFGENEWVQDIQNQVKRLTGLTEDLTYLSRMDENQSALQFLEFPFSDLVSETAQSFHALALTQNKEFHLNIEGNLSLRGDEKALSHFITILLDNAVKYCPEGGTITLSLEKKGRFICLKVFNTTDSALPQNLNQLFDRFYRGDQSRSSQIEGYGIGLSIAQTIVLSHKGKLSASSADGHSLLMTALFPI